MSEKRKWTITVNLEEINDNSTVTGALFEHLMDWLNLTKRNKAIKDFKISFENDALRDNYERNMRRYRAR